MNAPLDRAQDNLLHSFDANPVPEGAVTGFVMTDGGVRLRYARWQRRSSARKGTVAIFGGRGECIEVYYETITDLLERGFDVVAMDWRGQGGSDRLLRNRMKGHVGHFSDYEADVAALQSEVLLPDCPPPYFALAHSTGAAVLLRVARRRSAPFSRMVLVSPLLGLSKGGRWGGVFPLAHVIAGLGFDGVTTPGKPPSDFPGNPLTSDRRRFERNRGVFDRAPELRVGRPTFGWLSAAAAAIHDARQPDFVKSVHVPVLIIGGTLDTIVDNVAIETMGRSLRVGRHIMVAGARHELLMERDELRDQVWAAFDAFIPGVNPG